MRYNGPAIWGGCVTRRSIRQLSWYSPAGEPYNCPGARRVWRGFCHHGTMFFGARRGRGTKLGKCRKHITVLLIN